MDVQRAGAWALIAGSILTVIVFALHPAHVSAAPVVGPFTLSQLVHGTALVGVPLLAFGMWQMGEWLGLRRATVRLALVLAGLAMVLTVNAAVFSNFVTPAAARASAEAAQRVAGSAPRHGHAAAAASPLIRTSVATNRGYAQVHVGYLSLAILLFGWALRRRSVLLGYAGMIVGAAPVAWQLTGTFSPETTTMPFIVFPQCAWLIAAAVSMHRTGEGEGRG